MQASGTIGGTFLAKKIMVDGTFITLKIWDTAGQVAHTHTRTHTHTHTHTHTPHTHSLSHTHTLSLSLSHTHTQ